MEDKKKEKAIGLFLDASGTLMDATVGGVQLYPDTKAILKCCADRKLGETPIKTGIITNWGSRIQSMLSRLKLESHFDVVVHADLVPLHKPQMEFFQLAVEEIGLDARQCYHIGDSFMDDALGAQGAGLHAIWLNRTGMSIGEEEKKLKNPWFQDLDEVLNFLLTSCHS